MKRKPHPWIISCLTVFLFLGFPSCDGPDYAAIRGISMLEVYDTETGNVVNHLDSTFSDSIALLIYPVIEYFTEAHQGTMSSAWALSPPDPWMANELVDIRVFSDKAIYGFQPGENLASVLHYGDPSFQGSLEAYLDDIPRKGDDGSFFFHPIEINFSSKPAADAYTFTVEMEDNNGHVFTSSSPAFVWQ